MPETQLQSAIALLGVIAIARLLWDGELWPTLVWIAALLLIAPGCFGWHESRPVSGGEVAVMSDGSVIVRQPDNAKDSTRATITRADGTHVNAVLGTSSQPLLKVRPGPPWTRIIISAAGVICVIGGGVLWAKTWTRIGGSLFACGLLLIGIAVTAEEYAWVIALITAAVFALLIGGLWYGYRKGEQQPATPAIA